MTIRFLSLFLITILLSGSGFSQNINTAKLDSFFNVLSTNSRVMGSFAVAKNGKIIYKRHIGYSRIDSLQKTAANKNTVYDIGSVSKLFTTTMVYQLIDRGKLLLSTTLDKYYPEIPNARDITIEHLLAHRSGLYDVANDDDDKTWETSPQTKEAVLNKIAHGKIHFLPGTQTLYNNSGYILLARIIEKITGRTYNENLQKMICSRIGLKHTYSPLTDTEKNAAHAYSLVLQWEKISDLYYPNDTGADNILSNPTDLIAFDEALLNGKLISAGSLKLMLTFKDEDTGTGVFRIPFYNKWAYGHDGDTYGMHSTVQYFAEDKLSIAYCINGEVYPHNAINIAIAKICYDYPYKIPSFNIFLVSKDILHQYAGIYTNSEKGARIAITQKDTVLLMQEVGKPFITRLYATKADEFEIPADNITIAFDLPKNEMTLRQDGESYLFRKIK